jgi:hypothetical protein
VAFYPTAGCPAVYGIIRVDGSYAMMTGREPGFPSGPPWYRSKNTSGLRFTVTPGYNEVNLELTTKPPREWSQRYRNQGTQAAVIADVNRR